MQICHKNFGKNEENSEKKGTFISRDFTIIANSKIGYKKAPLNFSDFFSKNWKFFCLWDILLSV